MKLDLKEGYYQIYIIEGYKWKTTFRIYYRHYEYLMMLLGFINTSAIFQRMINEIFKEYLNDFVIAYLDNILIYSDILEEYIQHVYTVLSLLKKYNLLMEPKKSFFYI